MRARTFFGVIALLAVGCTNSSATNLSDTEYTINVSVTGPSNIPPGQSTGASVCVSYSNPRNTPPCSGNILFGQTGKILAQASPGEAYSVYYPTIPGNTQTCSVTSGGAGLFGPSMATVVVSCKFL